VTFVLLAGKIGHSGKCDACGVSLKRSAYEWKVKNKAVRVCPNCNLVLERNKSDLAFGRGDPNLFANLVPGRPSNLRQMLTVVGAFLTLGVCFVVCVNSSSLQGTVGQSQDPPTPEATPKREPKVTSPSVVETEEEQPPAVAEKADVSIAPKTEPEPGSKPELARSKDE
jgi:hypothetical protein